MIVIYGQAFYGKVREMGSTGIATRFVHVYYLPVIPTETHLILDRIPGGPIRSVRLRLHPLSVFCGYARVWGPIVTAIGLLAVATSWSHVGAMAFWGVVAAVAACASYLAFFAFGKISPLEHRQRLVYWYHLGYPVDPADMGDARPAYRAHLAATVAAASHGAIEAGYRAAPDAAIAWPRVALDPTQRDPRFVGAALTLARFDASLAPEAERASHDMLHASLWSRFESEGWGPPPSPG